MSRLTTCATRAETAPLVGGGEGQTSVNLADVRLILFYTLRKKCRIPRTSNDGLTTYSTVREEASQFTHQNLPHWSSFHSVCSSDSSSRTCALRYTRQKPSPITNHGGFGTRPPTDARARTHLARSGHGGRRNVNVATRAVDRRRGLRGRRCRNDVAQAQCNLRAYKLGSTLSTILT